MPSGSLPILQSLFGIQQQRIWSEMTLLVKEKKECELNGIDKFERTELEEMKQNECHFLRSCCDFGAVLIDSNMFSHVTEYTATI